VENEARKKENSPQEELKKIGDGKKKNGVKEERQRKTLNTPSSFDGTDLKSVLAAEITGTDPGGKNNLDLT